MAAAAAAAEEEEEEEEEEREKPPSAAAVAAVAWPLARKLGLHLPRAAVRLGARAALASRWGQAPGAAGVADQGLGAAEALR